MTVLINVPRASALLGREGLDAMIATGFENIGYVTGFVSPASWWLRQRAIFGTFALAVAGAGEISGRVAIVPVTQATHFLSRNLDGVEVVPYGHFPIFAAEILGEADQRLMATIRRKAARSAIEALADVVATLGLRRGRIGIDTSGVSPEEYQEIARALEGVIMLPATALFREIRAVKTQEEQRRLRIGARILNRAILESARAVREGMTEIELTREFIRHVIDADASTTFIAIGFGERTAYPGVIPSERRLRHGDLIRYDCGCIYDLYHSDNARTFAFGASSEKTRRYYQATLEGEKRAIHRAASGVPVREVFAAAMEATREAGIPHYERAHIGHAIGLEIYEQPMFRPDSDAVLERGMVLTIETPYYEIGTGGLMPEDIVLITESGAECLTEPDNDLTVL